MSSFSKVVDLSLVILAWLSKVGGSQNHLCVATPHDSFFHLAWKTGDETAKLNPFETSTFNFSSVSRVTLFRCQLHVACCRQCLSQNFFHIVGRKTLANTRSCHIFFIAKYYSLNKTNKVFPVAVVSSSRTQIKLLLGWDLWSSRIICLGDSLAWLKCRKM